MFLLCLRDSASTSTLLLVDPVLRLIPTGAIAALHLCCNLTQKLLYSRFALKELFHGEFLSLVSRQLLHHSLWVPCQGEIRLQ